jgi:hypothetical protein
MMVIANSLTLFLALIVYINQLPVSLFFHCSYKLRFALAVAVSVLWLKSGWTKRKNNTQPTKYKIMKKPIVSVQ